MDDTTEASAAPGVAVRPAKVRHQARTVGAQRIRWGNTTTRRAIRWTVALKETFLDHLAATCNVHASAAAIGIDAASAYHLRRADAAFVVAWGEALALGYQMLETQLVGHALAGGGAQLVNGATELTGPIDVELAFRLLAMHNADRTPGRPVGNRRQVARPEATDAAILKKLAQFAREDAAAAARAGDGA